MVNTLSIFQLFKINMKLKNVFGHILLEASHLSHPLSRRENCLGNNTSEWRSCRHLIILPVILRKNQQVSRQCLYLWLESSWMPFYSTGNWIRAMERKTLYVTILYIHFTISLINITKTCC